MQKAFTTFDYTKKCKKVNKEFEPPYYGGFLFWG